MKTAEEDNEKSVKPYMTSAEIQACIPHRYPFLLIDRVLEFVDNEKVVAIKNVSVNEPFFQGHFPERPVMPGVLILEAMAQTAAILAKISSDGVGQDKFVYLVGVDNVKWRKQIVPGDTLRIVVTSHKKRRPYWIMNAEVFVDDKVVASGTISAVEAP
jgi:3-hydroxyacyl-[acyl-carrier-protein] dehydratase